MHKYICVKENFNYGELYITSHDSKDSVLELIEDYIEEMGEYEEGYDVFEDRFSFRVVELLEGNNIKVTEIRCEQELEEFEQ